MSKAGVTPKLKFVDTGYYPGGVPNILTGKVDITQPDQITRSGSFITPDVYWDSGSLFQPELELRLASNGSFQNGTYTITYTVRATGYSDTVLTKTFNLNYTPSIPVLTKAFDLFTPQLKVTDSTSYGQSGMTLTDTTRSWSASIQSVSGTNQTVTGSTVDFDLAYLGSYYDSKYVVDITVNPEYVLNSPIDWVTIVDKLLDQETYYAEIPKTIAQLRALLSTLKLSIDECVCSGNTCTDCSANMDKYVLAESIYSHLLERGRKSDLSGLSLYVIQLEKIFNSCVTPTYTNTNAVIPVYDWGISGGGSSAWVDITGKPSTVRIQWVVGDVGYPGNGATSITDARFANVAFDRIEVYRTGLEQHHENPGNGDSYSTKSSTATNIVGFAPAITTGERMTIKILPL